MAATSALENEDLENVPLVRMEDVQPDRYEDVNELEDHVYIINDVVIKDEILETCVVDSFESDCIVNDEEGNVMVRIHAEVFDEHSSELIVPDTLEPPLDEPLEIKEEVIESKPDIQEKAVNASDGWPTLEILPGGVIKNADTGEKVLDSLDLLERNKLTTEEMMYACAKCSESFKSLVCLVKHVSSHNKQKKVRGQDVQKSKSSDSKNCICVHPNKRKIISKLKSRCKEPKKT